ncbi:MAG TPA: hypothetical protein VHW60_17700 [Caulobacteraceae bacterium]|jgi:hypothetical protein|nr:hypothetical protein [Caulobacteraceae bacterium]
MTRSSDTEWAHHYASVLRENLPLHPLDYFERFVEGDEWIGASLFTVTPSDWRGYFVLWLYHSFKIGRVSQALFRDLLAYAWEHDDIPIKAAAGFAWHGEVPVKAAALPHDLIQSMFRAAEFPIRPDLTPTIGVDVWRGTAETSLSAAQRGFSWTTHRDYACWHALEHIALRGSGAWATARRPLVIKARVAASELIFLPNERSECEALHFGGAIGEIDGSGAEWRLSAERWQDTPRARSTRQLPMPIPRALQISSGPIWLTDDRPVLR